MAERHAEVQPDARAEGMLPADPQAVVVVDEAQRIVMMSPAAERMFGCDAQGALGSELARLIPLLGVNAQSADGHQCNAPGVAERSVITRRRISGLLANGQELPAEATISRLQTTDEFGSRTFYAVLLRDLDVASGVEHELQKRNAERVELEQSRHELRQLSASLTRAREGARLHIARELHDELGQRLSALKLDLASLEAADGSNAFAERIAAMLGMLDETMKAVRRIAADLRPLMLDDLGLNAALEWLARESARRMGIEITVRLGSHDPALDSEGTIAVYRIVQEALTNAARHARATDVRVELRESGTELVLTVQDNGVGFAPDAARKPGSFGLLGIRERAQLLGGSMHIDNPLAGGARIRVRLPLHAQRERAPGPHEGAQ